MEFNINNSKLTMEYLNEEKMVSSQDFKIRTTFTDDLYINEKSLEEEKNNIINNSNIEESSKEIIENYNNSVDIIESSNNKDDIKVITDNETTNPIKDFLNGESFDEE